MEELGVEVDNRVNSTPLKERLHDNLPDMPSYTKGRDVLMAFEMTLALLFDDNKDAMHIAHTAQIVCRHTFGEAKPFNGFPKQCQ